MTDEHLKNAMAGMWREKHRTSTKYKELEEEREKRRKGGYVVLDWEEL